MPLRNPFANPERSLDTMSEAIALSSPSGRMSGRARKAALSRLSHELFGPEGLQRTAPPSPTVEQKRDRLLQRAQELRDLADRGMKPRAFRKEADRLEEEARHLNPRSPRARNPWALSDATVVIDPQGAPHEEPGYRPRTGHPRIAQALGYPGIAHAIVAGAVRAYIHNREVGVSFAHNNTRAARNAVSWLESLRGSDADSVVIDTRRGGGDTKLYEMSPSVDAAIRFIRERQIQGVA